MKKKFWLILIIVILLISLGIVYLNNVLLPTKIRYLIINSLQENVKGKVTVESLRFNVFRGLVLKDLAIYENELKIISAKEASCTFLIWPFFKKMVIIPGIRLKYPEVFLERNKTGALNIQNFFSNTPSSSKANGFQLRILKIIITNATIHFQDNSVVPPFAEEITDFNLKAYLSLTSSVKFNFKSQIQTNSISKIFGSGEYRLADKQLFAKISVQNLPPEAFSVYYVPLGLNIKQGILNSQIGVRASQDILYLDGQLNCRELEISKGKISVKLDSDVQGEFLYDLAAKKIAFQGKAKIFESSLLGLDTVGPISKINGELAFNNSGIASEKLSANILGVPIAAKINLNNYDNPLLKVNIISKLGLEKVADILKEKFKLSLPADFKGEGELSLDIQTKIAAGASLEMRGLLDFLNGSVKLEKLNLPFEGVLGRLEFSQDQLEWKELNFKYQGVAYKTTGSLNNFKVPEVKLELYSKGLILDTGFQVNNKLIKLSKCLGRYLNSDFSFAGNLNFADSTNLNSNITGKLNLNLEDTKDFFIKIKKNLEVINPQGNLGVQFSLQGNILDFKSCVVTAKLSSPALSIYGFKAQDSTSTYNQSEGVIELPDLHLSCYEGTIDASAKLNLNSANQPYLIQADIQGVKLEKLKLDTAAKKEDISGTLKAQVNLNGFSNDLNLLSGQGSIFITEGKLWQLNLLKGLGSLLFAKDFANITFKEGSCSFSAKDRHIYTNDLKLKSEISNLTGSINLGFDSSIDASLNVEVLDQMVPLTGTFKDVTTAIIGQAGRFGVIKISGTLKEPKYKFQPAVVDIFKGIKNTFFGK